MLLGLGFEELPGESQILFVGGSLVGPCWKLVKLQIRYEFWRLFYSNESILWNWKVRRSYPNGSESPVAGVWGKSTHLLQTAVSVCVLEYLGERIC